MAAGAPDTNGVWQYGEDDSDSLFSDLLNRLASSVSTALTAIKNRLLALESGAAELAKATLAGTPALGSAYAAIVWSAATTTAGVTWSATNPTRLTIGPGKWLIGYKLTTGGVSTGLLRTQLALDGAVLADSTLNVPGASGLTDPFAEQSYPYVSTGTHYFEVQANTNLGSGATLVGTGCRFTAVKVG